MANETLAELSTAITPLSGTELVYGTQLGGDAKITTQSIADLAGPGGGGFINQTIVTVTGAQLEALAETPVTIIPAPGVGLMTMILQAIYVTTGASQFELGGPAGLYYNNNSDFIADGLGVSSPAQAAVFNQGDDQAPSAFHSFSITGGTGQTGSSWDPDFTVNQPITYSNFNSDYNTIQGDGTLDTISMNIIVLWYTISL